jgi:hypothetical protein
MKLNQRLLFLILQFFVFSISFAQTDTVTVKVKILKKQPAPQIVPTISKIGILEKLTAKGCSNEIRWFDNKSRFISIGEIEASNLTGKIKAVCQSVQSCPSDTAFFVINQDFEGKIEKSDSSQKTCIGSEITFNIHQCNGKVYWNDDFRQVDSRTINVSQTGILKYSFRCLNEKGISKWNDIKVEVSKPTLQDLVV